MVDNKSAHKIDSALFLEGMEVLAKGSTGMGEFLFHHPKYLPKES